MKSCGKCNEGTGAQMQSAAAWSAEITILVDRVHDLRKDLRQLERIVEEALIERADPSEDFWNVVRNRRR